MTTTVNAGQFEKNLNKLSDTELRHVATFILTDGGACLSKFKRPNGGVYMSPHVYFCNTELPVLQNIRKLFGDQKKITATGRPIGTVYKGIKVNKTCFNYTLTGRNAVALLQKVEPLLVGRKKNTAKICMDYHQFNKKHSYRGSQGGVPQNVLDKREWYYEAAKQSNKGVDYGNMGTNTPDKTRKIGRSNQSGTSGRERNAPRLYKRPVQNRGVTEEMRFKMPKVHPIKNIGLYDN